MKKLDDATWFHAMADEALARCIVYLWDYIDKSDSEMENEWMDVCSDLKRIAERMDTLRGIDVRIATSAASENREDIEEKKDE